MRAIGLRSFEQRPEILDLPTPEPAAGEVLVNVSHASVNGFDVAVAAGGVRDYMEHRFPVVLGKDFAGTVEAVGEGVSSVQVGDTVFGVLMRDYVGDGTFADYVVVPEAIGLTKMPAGLGLADAGALGLAGAAAHASIEALSPSKGETVLIGGATGGVGAKAMQLATRLGAEVVATARPGEEAEFVQELGATHVVDYTDDLPAQVRRIRPDGVDAAIHLAGDGMQIAELVRAGGRFASTLGLGGDQLGRNDIEATSVIAMPTRELLDRLAAGVVAGNLRVPVQRTYKLEEVPQALNDFAQGTLGKYAVTLI